MTCLREEVLFVFDVVADRKMACFADLGPSMA